MTSTLAVTSLDGASACFASSDTVDLLVSITNPLRLFNVASYGASGFDGSRNDTSAIQAAIDAASAYTVLNSNNWATVFFPRGIYGIVTLTINAPRIRIQAYDCTWLQLTGNAANQALYIKGEIDGGLASDIEIFGLTYDGLYPSITPNTGKSGIGFNIRAERIKLVDVKGYRTKDSMFISTYARFVNYHRCIGDTPGRSAFRLSGEYTVVRDCEAYDWNAVNASLGNRAILADGQDIDGESLYVDGFIAHMRVERPVTDGILIDNGDGDGTGSNFVPAGNSGQASNLFGKAAWTIDCGHGFKVRDAIKIQDSGVTAYSGASNVGKNHKILSVTGEVFVHVVDANTLQLYSSAAAAKAQTSNTLGNSTGRYDLLDSGTGTFYIKAAGGRRKQFTVLSTTNDTITVTAHGFHKGSPARLTVEDKTVDSLPGGLKDQAVIRTNTDYVSAGSGANYWRPKKIKTVTLRNIQMFCETPTTTDSAMLKVNNVNNLLIDRLACSCTPENSGIGYQSLRLGTGVRKATILNCQLPDGFVNNSRSFITDLEIAHCEVGNENALPDTAVNALAVANFKFHHNTVRFGITAISTAATADELSDENIEDWHIHDNVFIAAKDNQLGRLLGFGDSSHLLSTGKVRLHDNERMNIGTYAGPTVTAATNDTWTTTSFSHCLETGDRVRVTTDGTYPTVAGTAISSLVEYWVRRTGDTTLTLHYSEAGASDNSNIVDVTVVTASNMTLVSPKLGCILGNSSPRDRMLMQKGTSGREFWGVAAPSSSGVKFRVGDVVWNMNQASGQPIGWQCTKTGVIGSAAATFLAMANLP